MKVVLKTYRLKGSDGYEVESEVEIEKAGWHIIRIKYKDTEFSVDKQELYKALKLLM